MKKIIIYFLAVLLVTVMIDILFSFATEKAISSGKVYSLFENKSISTDIAIIGASRAVRHYNPQIFSKRMDCGVKVFGKTNRGVIFHYAILKTMLNSTITPPKIVLLEVAETDINIRTDLTYEEELSVLYPFYYSEPAVREVLDDVLDKKELFMMKYSSLYRNNSKIIPYFVSLFKGRASSLLYGYLPLYNVWTKPIAVKKENVKVDPVKIRYMNNVFELCKQNKIKLVVLMSPSYRILQGEKWKEKIKAMAVEYNIPVIDYEQDSTFLAHQEWFNDSYHLNKVGSDIYSNRIVDELGLLLNGGVEYREGKLNHGLVSNPTDDKLN